MATGDQADLTARLKAVLPRWFGNGATPALDGLLQAPAWALSFVYSLIAYAKAQTRISTATGGWLDLIAADFFGARSLRRTGQSDQSYRANILATILRPKVTHDAMVQALTTLTGRPPIVIEPSRVADTGAWDSPVGYWDQQGFWGGAMPFQAAVIAFRPLVGSDQYGVSDEDIRLTIEAVRPEATVIWFQIQD